MNENIEFLKDYYPILYGLLMQLPSHCIDSIADYLVNGVNQGGSFVQAFLKNDFLEFFSRADDSNRAAALSYAKLMHQMPLGSYGSKKNILDWQKQGGLKGTKINHNRR